METDFISMVLQSMLALAAVLGIFALLVWGMKRFQLHNGLPARGDFRIVQRIHLDSKNSIVEIRHRGRHYLLAVSHGAITQLRESDALSAEQTAEIDGETNA